MGGVCFTFEMADGGDYEGLRCGMWCMGVHQREECGS